MDGRGGTVTSHQPKGLLRFALRLPIWLYRLHLGWLLGERFLRLTHVGRKSRLERQTVIEVVDHDKTTDTYLIASGWGEKSDWFRNVQQTPQVSVDVGWRHFRAVAHRLPIDEAGKALLKYAHYHPKAFAELTKMMLGKGLQASLEDCNLAAQSIPLVALQPS